MIKNIDWEKYDAQLKQDLSNLEEFNNQIKDDRKDLFNEEDLKKASKQAQQLAKKIGIKTVKIKKESRG